MKVTIRVGQASVTVEGLDYTRRQVTALLATVTTAAAMVGEDEPERPPVALGFTTEILPEELAGLTYEDEE